MKKAGSLLKRILLLRKVIRCSVPPECTNIQARGPRWHREDSDIDKASILLVQGQSTPWCEESGGGVIYKCPRSLSVSWYQPLSRQSFTSSSVIITVESPCIRIFGIYGINILSSKMSPKRMKRISYYYKIIMHNRIARYYILCVGYK